MGADDAWPAEIKRLPFTPDPDPLAVDEDLAERLLDGDLPWTRRHLGTPR